MSAQTTAKQKLSHVHEQDKNSETIGASANFTLSNLLNTSLGIFSSDSANNRDKHQAALTERAHTRGDGDSLPSFDRQQI